MRTRINSNAALIERCYPVFAVLFLNLVVLTVTCVAQTCLPPDSDTLPHYPQGGPVPGSGSVAYTFLNIPAGTERTQIEYALSLWNAELALTCADLVYVPGPAGEEMSVLSIRYGNPGVPGAAAIFESLDFNGVIYSGTITFDPTLTFPSGQLFYDPNLPGYNTVYQKIALHEIGHSLGLTHYTSGYPDGCVDQLQNSSVMNNGCDYNDHYNFIAIDPTGCDMPRIPPIYPCPTPSPTPTPSPWGPVGGCNGPPFEGGTCSTGFVYTGGMCQRSNAFINQCYQNGGDFDPDGCGCTGSCAPFCSPIVVDVIGNGFSLTNATNGVNFNLDNSGLAERIGWTSSGSDDAWLALDRNYDGLIDRGRELFGNVTAQEPASNGQMNGFRALALFDGPGYGGNSDGKISSSDLVFNRLKLWQDQNHNGVSESCEMFSLPDLGLLEIDLDYKVSNQVDQHGNAFRFRTKVKNVQGPSFGRWAWDVFLVVQQ